MKKILSLILILFLLAVPACLAEQEAEEATAIGTLIENMDETTEIPADLVAECDPFVPDDLDRTIIGYDDRITITDPSVYPYSAIGYMKVHARCGCEWTASGSMISERGFLTGAHCVVCTDHGATADSIKIYFGYDRTGSSFYVYTGPTHYWYGTNFSNGDGTYSYSGPAYDYAYILLDDNVGDYTGWFGVRWCADSDLLYNNFTLTGYRDGIMKKSYGYVSNVSSNTIRYDNDSLPGNSGCPVYDDDFYVVAIHVQGGETSNGGHRFTYSLYQDMVNNGLY